MGNRIEGLSVRELLNNTYLQLSERHKPRHIVLSAKSLAEIADDSDWHRIRVGYMGYESVGLFKFDGGIWVVARGEACGSYPADPYDSDILALKFLDEEKTPEQIQAELGEEIRQSSYFRNSLIYGMADGNLAVSRNERFGKIMMEILKPEIGRFIAQEPEYNLEILSASTLEPVCEKPVKYKLEFVDFLADSIEAVLKD